jgi:hypothetical protein
MNIFENPYKYTPLKGSQIRLLRLLPGPRNADLEGSLEPHWLVRPTDADLEDSIKGEDLIKTFRATWELPDYEALSYHWGPKDKNAGDFYIKLLEGSQSYRVSIRSNLVTALRQLRSANDNKYLWVDALCMDQGSNEEKNVQIPRMTEIYNKAKGVCIWLGEERDNSGNAMAFARRLLDLDAFSHMQNPKEAYLWVEFATLLRRPWFNRRWIVQELAVARNAMLYCGEEKLEWRKFADAVSLFASKYVNLKDIFKGAESFGHNPNYLGDVKELGAYQLVHVASNFFRKSDTGDILDRLLSLEEIVSALAAFDALDGHDVIYAVLALSNDVLPRNKDSRTGAYDREKLGSVVEKHLREKPNPASPTDTRAPPLQSGRNRRPSNDWRITMFVDKGVNALLRPFRGITIDYDQPVFEVYKEFVKIAITNSQSLDIICRPWAANEGDLPSWIPRKIGATHGLRQNRAYSRVRADLLVGSPRVGGKNYSASGSSLAIWRYDNEILKRSLVVEGFVLDGIEKKYVPAMGGIIPAEWRELDDSESEERGEKRKNRLQVQDAFWRTLVGDRGPEGQKPPPSYYKLAYEYAFNQSTNHGYLDSRELIMENCPPMVKEFLERVQSVVWMRRLILTREKRLPGLVPYETKKTDLICILYGCSVPVVLRRHDIPRDAGQGVSIQVTEAAPPTEQTPASTSGSHPNSVERSEAYRNAEHPFVAKEIATEGRGSNSTLHPLSSDGRHISGQLSSPSGTSNQTTTDHNADNPNAHNDSLRTETTRNVVADAVIERNDNAGQSVQQTGKSPDVKINSSSTNSPKKEVARDRSKKDEREDGVRPIGKEDRTESWQSKSPEAYYEFIGECYVHGMMDGEATKSPPHLKEYFWLR